MMEEDVESLMALPRMKALKPGAKIVVRKALAEAKVGPGLHMHACYYIYVCVCVCKNIYIYTYIHTQTNQRSRIVVRKVPAVYIKPCHYTYMPACTHAGQSHELQ